MEGPIGLRRSGDRLQGEVEKKYGKNLRERALSAKRPFVAAREKSASRSTLWALKTGPRLCCWRGTPSSRPGYKGKGRTHRRSRTLRDAWSPAPPQEGPRRRGRKLRSPGDVDGLGELRRQSMMPVSKRPARVEEGRAAGASPSRGQRQYIGVLNSWTQRSLP